MKARSIFAFATLAVVLAIPGLADAKLSKTGNAKGAFHASGPAGLVINGTTSEVDVSDDGTSVSVVVKLTAISTGISLRDKHTRNYLETDTYPTATLKVARASLKFPETGKEIAGDAKGSMTIHGVTKDVTFHYTAKREGDTFSVKGNTALNINDYGIKTPSYLGVAVKPDITVDTEFQAKDN